MGLFKSDAKKDNQVNYVLSKQFTDTSIPNFTTITNFGVVTGFGKMLVYLDWVTWAAQYRLTTDNSNTRRHVRGYAAIPNSNKDFRSIRNDKFNTDGYLYIPSDMQLFLPNIPIGLGGADFNSNSFYLSVPEDPANVALLNVAISIGISIKI